MFRHPLAALALLAACALPLAISAQTYPATAPDAAAPPAAAAHHHHRNPYMRAMRNLNLSDAQKQQIMAFFKSSRSATKVADKQTRRATMLALHKQIEGVLTDDQRTQLRTELERGRRNADTSHDAAPHGFGSNGTAPNGMAPNGSAPQGPAR